MKRKSLVILVAASLLLVILPKVRKYPNEGPEVKDASERAQALRSQKQKHTAAIPAGPMSFWKSLDDSPAWAIPYGGEFWRRATDPPTQITPVGLGAPLTEHVNIGDLIARVSHAISEDLAGEFGTASGRGF